MSEKLKLYIPQQKDKYTEHNCYNHTYKNTQQYKDKYDDKSYSQRQKDKYDDKSYPQRQKDNEISRQSSKYTYPKEEQNIKLIKLINNYEIVCKYHINMNNYYKNVNIYNYKK
jgi:hypothetical protein